MMSIRLYLLFPIAFTLASLHALPFVPRPDRLFGVSVPREIRYGSEGRQILRRYQLQLLPWTAAVFLAALWLPVTWVVFVSLVPMIAAGWIFSRRRAEARPFALPAPSTREVQLTDTDDRPLQRMLWFLPPLAILAGTALYLHVHWNEIPARFPVHWGMDGTPNGWSTRTFTGVYGPLIFGAIVVLSILAIFAVTSWGSRMSARHPACQTVPIVVAYMIATGFSLAGLLPLHSVPLWGLLAFNVAFIGLLAAMVWRSLRRRVEPGTEAGEITPESGWHYWNQFYYNPQDPALFVEKRIGLGWTFNFANRLSWIVLPLMLLIPIGLVFLATKFKNR